MGRVGAREELRLGRRLMGLDCGGRSWQSSRFPVAVAQAKTKAMSYTNYFADALTAEAERDSRIVAVHAAMAGGTGLYR